MSDVRAILKQFLPNWFLQLSRPPRRLARRLITGVTTAMRLRALAASPQPLYLELGPGSSGLGRPWTGIDISGYADLRWDLRKRLPFADESVSGIYSCHVLEHFAQTDLVHLLGECRRVLKRGGFFLCAVPDAGKYVAAFTNAGIHEELRTHAGTSDYCVTGSPMDLLNMTAYMHGQHFTLFDDQYLSGVLRSAGFTHVGRRHYDGRFDLPERDWESLYGFAADMPFEQCAMSIDAARPERRR